MHVKSSKLIRSGRELSSHLPVELAMVRSAQSDTILVVADFVSYTNSSVIGRGLARITKGWDPSAQIPSASG
ncbi:MAG TPA: hypothetical protein VK462_07350 [Nitrososphaeraceae archaeon]|nr:hypothetical protein [Nitrososphaeraceae archaeon]